MQSGQNDGFLNVKASGACNYHFGFQFNRRSITLCGNRSAKKKKNSTIVEIKCHNIK